jgi:hypothetical protein
VRGIGEEVREGRGETRCQCEYVVSVVTEEGTFKALGGQRCETKQNYGE